MLGPHMLPASPAFAPQCTVEVVAELAAHVHIAAYHGEPPHHPPRRILRYALGILFVGFSGIPLLRPVCTESSCLGQASRSASFSYHFLSWMDAGVLSASVNYQPPGGPQMTLRARRAVTYEARIFEYARRSDTSGLKFPFTTGVASPNDVSSVGGSNALHVWGRPLVWVFLPSANG